MFIDIKETDEELKKISKQRKKWLTASFVVFVGIILLITLWEWIDTLNSKAIWWVIVSFILVISVNWWYWTMKVLHQLINHQRLEFFILYDIIKEIKAIKDSITQLKN